MKRLLFLFLSLALIVPAAPVQADVCPGLEAALFPRGYQQLTVSSTAVALTLPAGPLKVAIIQVEDNSIRYRDDGTDPTAAVGTLINANVPIIVCGPAIAGFKAIRVTADAKLSISYYGD